MNEGIFANKVYSKKFVKSATFYCSPSSGVINPVIFCFEEKEVTFLQCYYWNEPIILKMFLIFT